MNRAFCSITIFLLLGLTFQGLNAQQEDWTHFRGSNLDGISADEKAPLRWNDSLNIAWRVKVPGKGWSSPVVSGNQVWITSASVDGSQMYGRCYDFNSGKELFAIKVLEPAKVDTKHDLNSYATPTPCIEGGFVYLHFGTYGTACLRTSDGSVVWKRTDLKCEHIQGPASSPILYKNLLILHLEGSDVQYLIALDKGTGKTVWKSDRPKDLWDKLPAIGRKAYITPLIVNINGHNLLISNGSAACIAYDPETGAEVWRVTGGEDSTIAMPVSENGIVYFYTAFFTPAKGEQYCELLAVDPSGHGDVTASKVLWKLKSPVLQLLTPLVKKGLIYTVDTKNNLQVIDAVSGMIISTKRLTKKYQSSPVYAAGKIYFTSVDGETMIISEGAMSVKSVNRITGKVFATPAIVRESVVLRTENELMRITDRNL